MNLLGARIKKLREREGIQQNEFAKKISVSNVVLSRYESGERKPDYDTLQRIADFFDVTIDYLLGRTEIRKLASSRLDPIKDFFRIPLLGYIAAGEPIFATEHIVDYIDIPPPGDYDPDELFMLRVKGDSMIGSRIYEGDKVLVKMQPEVENGEIAVVNVNGDEATLKRVKKLDNGQTLLIASNDKYDPILINHESARVIGKVIQVIFEP